MTIPSLRNNSSRRGGVSKLSGNFILVSVSFVGILSMLAGNVYYVIWQRRSRKSPLVPFPLGPSITVNDSDEQHILTIFKAAGITLDQESMAELPTWAQIRDHIGDAPTIYGLDTCARFRSTIPAVERNLGCSGMFNSGTNLVTQLLKQNCQIPERVERYGIHATREAHGIRWQVPWGKHTHAKYREEHSTEKARSIRKETVLPVITVRHPYHWMATMCRHPYSAKWEHPDKICPHLVNKRQETMELSVKYADDRVDHHSSLAHLWNDWYRYYYDTTLYPRIIVRFEDLIIHAKNLTHQICECAGGKVRTDRPFQYIVESAKDGPGHGSVRTGMVAAWIKYGKPLGIRAGFSKEDYEAAKEFLNSELMETFYYKHPRAN